MRTQLYLFRPRLALCGWTGRVRQEIMTSVSGFELVPAFSGVLHSPKRFLSLTVFLAQHEPTPSAKAGIETDNHPGVLDRVLQREVTGNVRDIDFRRVIDQARR